MGAIRRTVTACEVGGHRAGGQDPEASKLRRQVQARAAQRMAEGAEGKAGLELHF